MTRQPARAKVPRISVVVPFYDAEGYLRQAIESVLRQSFGDWELLLMDDGSRDRGRQIADEFVRRDPARIRVLRHRGDRRLGAFRSRIAASKRARARLVALLDADDEWQPGLLESRSADYRRAFGSRPGVVYGPGVFLWEKRGRASRLELQPVPKPGMYDPTELLAQFLEESYVKAPLTTGTVVHRQILIEAERIAPVSLRPTIEDVYLWTFAALRYPAFVSSKPLFWYRRHPHSEFSGIVARGEFLGLRQRHLQWLLRHVSKSGLKERDRLAQLVKDSLASLNSR